MGRPSAPRPGAPRPHVARTSLNRNLSPSSTSLPLGVFSSTRTSPQARDWRVRRSSLSSMPLPRRMSSSPSSSLPLNSCSTTHCRAAGWEK